MTTESAVRNKTWLAVSHEQVLGKMARLDHTYDYRHICELVIEKYKANCIPVATNKLFLYAVDVDV